MKFTVSFFTKSGKGYAVSRKGGVSGFEALHLAREASGIEALPLSLVERPLQGVSRDLDNIKVSERHAWASGHFADTFTVAVEVPDGKMNDFYHCVPVVNRNDLGRVTSVSWEWKPAESAIIAAWAEAGYPLRWDPSDPPQYREVLNLATSVLGEQPDGATRFTVDGVTEAEFKDGDLTVKSFPSINIQLTDGGYIVMLRKYATEFYGGLPSPEKVRGWEEKYDLPRSISQEIKDGDLRIKFPPGTFQLDVAKLVVDVATMTNDEWGNVHHDGAIVASWRKNATGVEYYTPGGGPTAVTYKDISLENLRNVFRTLFGYYPSRVFAEYYEEAGQWEMDVSLGVPGSKVVIEGYPTGGSLGIDFKKSGTSCIFVWRNGERDPEFMSDAPLTDVEADTIFDIFGLEVPHEGD